MELSDASLQLAGILLLTLVTIEFGGHFMLRVVQGHQPTTEIQKSFFRAGHAHAGMFVTLSLVIQPFVDATSLDGGWAWLARSGVPIAAILVPAGFFLSVTRKNAEAPNQLIWLLYGGMVMLGAGVVTLGIGLLTT